MVLRLESRMSTRRGTPLTLVLHVVNYGVVLPESPKETPRNMCNVE